MIGGKVKVKIRVKITLAMVVLLIASVVFIGVFAYFNTSSALQEQKETEFTNNIANLQEIINNSIEDTGQFLSFMVSTPAMRSYIDNDDGELGSAKLLLKEAKKVYDRAETLLFTDNRGNVIASSDSGESIGMDFSDREYFQEACKGNIAISEVIVSRVSGNTAFTIAVPLMTGGGFVKGVLIAILNFDQVIGNHVQKVRVGESGYAWMVDREGLVVSHPDEQNVLKTNFTQDDNAEFAEMVRTMGQGAIGQSFYTFEGKQKFAAYRPVGNWAMAFTMDVDEYMAPARQIRNSILIAAVIFIIIGLVIANLISGYIANPVIALMRAMKKAEEGDLTVHVQAKGKDEIGQLSQSFNAMVAGQKDILSKVLESAASVAAASQELSASIEESNASMEEISSIVENEVTVKAQDIAGASDKASQNGHDTRDVAEKGVANVEEAVRAMELINNSAKEVGDVIAELFEASKQIGVIIETITGIAEQTNLLALNAAIEAARAGEQGRGFTVVAEEVRKLAEDSSRSAGEISGLIMNIQGKTKSAVDKMTETGGIMQNGAELAGNARKNFAEILLAVGQVVSLIEQMAAAAQEQFSLAEEISSSTQEQTAVLEEISATTSQLATMAEELNEIVAHFVIE